MEKYQDLYDICWSHKSIWHCEQIGIVEDHVEVWVQRQVQTISRWSECFIIEMCLARFRVTKGVKQCRFFAPILLIWICWQWWQMPSRKFPPGSPSVTGPDKRGRSLISVVSKLSTTSMRFWSETSLLMTAPIAAKQQEMQQEMDEFSSACRNYGLTQQH